MLSDTARYHLEMQCEEIWTEIQGRCKAFVGEDLVEGVQMILISISVNKIASHLSTAPSQDLLFLNRVQVLCKHVVLSLNLFGS